MKPALTLGLVALAGAGLAYALTRRSSSSSEEAPAEFNWDLVLSLTAAEESGGQWGRWNPRDRTSGASWGIIQFNQGAGSLGAVLGRWRTLDGAGFAAFWDGAGDDLVQRLTGDRARNLSLDLGPLAPLFQSAGAVPACRQAQADVAWSMYLQPLLPLARATWGLVDTPGAAILFDRSVQQGPGLAQACVRAAASAPSMTERQIGYMRCAIDRAEARDRDYIRARLARVLRGSRPAGVA